MNGAPGRRHLIIGASGVIGQQLFADLTASGEPTIGSYLHNAKAGLVPFDIHGQRLAELLPDISENDCIYLCAAATNHDWIHRNPAAARRINVDATQRLIDEALARGAWLVFLSSEIVFDGDQESYGETAPVAPLTLYGRYKVEVEEYLQRMNGRWCVVRTGPTVGWDQNASCPVFKTYRSLMQPGARMARDNVFSITDVRDTCRALHTLAQRGLTGVWHVAAAPPVVRTQLADTIIATSRFGHMMSYEPVDFRQLPYQEPRPRSTWLRSDKIREATGLSFRDAFDVIREKTRLLDTWTASWN